MPKSIANKGKYVDTVNVTFNTHVSVSDGTNCSYKRNDALYKLVAVTLT